MTENRGKENSNLPKQKNVRELCFMQESKKCNKSGLGDSRTDGCMLVALYNEVYNKNYPMDTPVEVCILKNTPYLEDLVDIAFTMDNQLVVVLVSKAPVEDKILLQMFVYVVQLYEKIIGPGALYRTEQILLPTPRLIVFEYGDSTEPKRRVKKLSDLSGDEQDSEGLELSVEVFNVGQKCACVPELLKRCKALHM